MAKKITLIMFVLLIASAFVFVSCKQGPEKPQGQGGQQTGTVDLELPDPIEENTFEHTVEVLDLWNTDFERGEGALGGEGATSDLSLDGASGVIVVGQGVNGSQALAVDTGSCKYGSTFVDLTEYYAPGKSYYVEASLKNNGSTNIDDLKAYLSYTVCSGVVKDYYKDHFLGKDEEDYYDCGDIYGYPFMTEDDALNLYGSDYPTRGTTLGIALKDDQYITVSGIIPATEIDAMILDQTKKYALYEDDEASLDYFNVCFFVGDYPNQNGRQFYIDNVIVVDLNAEIEAIGKTHKPKADSELDSSGL